MGDKRILKKLEEVNSEKKDFILKLERKGKILYERIVDIPEYAESILDDDDFNLYYFFKDMTNKLENLIDEAHKKKMWDELNKGKYDDTSPNQ